MTLYYFISLSHAHTHQVNTGDSGFQYPFYLLHNCCIECGTQNLFSLLQRAGIVLSFGVMLCEISCNKENGTIDSKRTLGMWLINALVCNAALQWRTQLKCTMW